MAGSPDAGTALPVVAAWEHLGARTGHEVVFFTVGDAGITIDGTTTATENGVAWWAAFHLELDPEWTTHRAEVWGRSTLGEHRHLLECDGLGRWRVDGVPDRSLDGCIDVDLESSACTNTVPVHRLDLQRGEREDAPAVYVRAADLAVERLDQRYELSADQSSGLGGHGTWRLGYAAPRFDADFDLTLDPFGLVVDYPHLARRTA